MLHHMGRGRWFLFLSKHLFGFTLCEEQSVTHLYDYAFFIKSLRNSDGSMADTINCPSVCSALVS